MKKFRGMKNKSNLMMWLLMTPALIYIFIFHYVPMFGLIVAFKDYNSYEGIFGSAWTEMGGFEHFYNFLTMPDFWKLLWNTLSLSCTSLFFAIVLPITFALIVNEIRSKKFKRVVQTISYAPYFISTVVVVSMLFLFTDVESGIINQLLQMMGADPVAFMEREDLFVPLYVIVGVWQALGWSAIIYVGTLSNVDQSQHEAAVLDGANRFQRIIHVNLPAIIPMAVINLLMQIGNLLNVGFEKVYLMQTPGNIPASRIISTYVYEVSLQSNIPQFSYATAIGLFNSVVNIILLLVANRICKKVSETSLW